MNTLDETMQELSKLLNLISDRIEYNQGRTEEGLRSTNCHIVSVDHYHNYSKEKILIELARMAKEIEKLDERILELEGANKESNYEITKKVSER